MSNCRPQQRGIADWVNIKLLDIAVSPLDAREAASRVALSDGKRLLLNHNLHSAYLHEINPDFRELYRRADWILIDGTPVLWLASLASKSRLASSLRIASPDWILALPEVHMSCKRLFVFGATPESNDKAVSKLRMVLPSWCIAGINGYVGEEVAMDALIKFHPDIVVVGLGMPRQELFLLRHYSQLPEAVYATVGGAIDYLAGVTVLAPRWVGKIGFEWLWRVCLEPRRLWYRYFVEPLLLLRRVLRRLARRRATSR